MGRRSIRMQQINEENRAEAAAEQSAVDPALDHYMAMHWNMVRRLAVERGLPVLGRTKQQIAADLAAADRG